jgi:prolipoprotein diacylglyceryl transferase
MASIPSPSHNGVDLGPFFVHYYGLAYVVAIAAAIAIVRRRWRAQGGDPDLVLDVAIWAVPAGILGGRLYHDLTSWSEVPHTWWGWAAVWQGGLGIWGGIAAGTLVGLWVLRRRGVDIARFMDATAPALLVAQAIGRIGNYFNQELFGGPTDLPWALQIDPGHRPAHYLADPTFHPVFLYELIFDLALAAGLVWLGHHRRVRAPGLFALYVAGYSIFRIFEELLRVDPAHHLLGLRLNLYIAAGLAAAAILWFARIQRGAGSVNPKRGPSIVAVGVAALLCGCGGADHASAASRHPVEDGWHHPRASADARSAAIAAPRSPGPSLN